jgi:hypothetical protein
LEVPVVRSACPAIWAVSGRPGEYGYPSLILEFVEFIDKSLRVWTVLEFVEFIDKSLRVWTILQLVDFIDQALGIRTTPEFVNLIDRQTPYSGRSPESPCVLRPSAPTPNASYG